MKDIQSAVVELGRPIKERNQLTPHIDMTVCEPNPDDTIIHMYVQKRTIGETALP